MTELPRMGEPAAPYLPPAVPRTSGSAVASLVFGILSFCTLGLAAVPGFVCGLLALRSVRQGGGKVEGRGLAIAGLVTSAVGLFVWLILFVPAVLVFLLWSVGSPASRPVSVMSGPPASVSELAAQSMIGMKMQAAAALAFAEEHGGRLPKAHEYPAALERYLTVGEHTVPPHGRAFAMNEAVAGLRLAEIPQPERTVLLFETGEGRSLVGGKERLRPLPRPGDAYVIAFVDGNVKWMTKEEVDGLIWQPEPAAQPIRL
jgi:hypothetical protein